MSWRSKEDLTLLAFFTAADDFRDLFLVEAQLNKKFFTEGTGSGLQPAEDLTPCRRLAEAMECAGRLVTPEPWTEHFAGLS